MTLLAPWILAGLAAAGLPILIHLLHRGPARPMPWAAMRFLVESVKKNRRRLRLRDFILLLLRVLVIALVVLLFARPAWLTADAGGGLRLPMTAMFVLDVSASMAQSDGQRTRMEEARAQALDLLDRLDAQSRAGLLLASDTVDPVIPRPSGNLPLVRGYLEKAAAGFRGSDLLPAVKKAFAALANAPGEHREVIVLTDSQRTAWRQRGEIAQILREHPGIGFRVLTVGKTGEENLAVSAVRPASGRALAGRPQPVAVEITNHGRQPAAHVRVTLAVDQSPPEDETTIAEIPAGASRTATLTARFEQPGPHTVTAAIPVDRFPPDNQRAAALEADDALVVTLVEDPGAGDAREEASFFLEKALNAGPGADTVTIRRQKFAGLASDAFEKSALIVLADPPSLPAATWQALREFVEKGGALMLFPGARTPATLGATPDTSWLPAKLGPSGPRAKETGWRQASMTHPATAAWRDPKRTNLTGLKTRRHFALAPAGPAAKPLAAFDDGQPVALDGPAGSGRVIIWSFLPTPAWTNLVLHPFFPIVMQELLPYLTNAGGSAASIKPGDIFRFETSLATVGQKVTLEPPNSDQRISAGEVEIAGERGAARAGPLEQPGGYRLFLGENEHPAAAFAVNLDRAESDLAALPADEVERLARPAADAPAESGGATVPALTPRELWLPLALVLAVLFFAELFYARYLSATR